jgi:hypothetical protein
MTQKTRNELLEDILVATVGGVSSSVVVVKSLSDFPDPVLKDGVLTIIPEDKQYLLDNDITSAYPISHPGDGKRATFCSVNRSVWTYTGTDSCFRDLDASGDVEIFGLTQFEAPNGNMWDLDNSTGDAWSYQAQSGPRFTNTQALGTIKGGVNGGGLNLHFGTISNFDQGLVIEDLFFFEVNLMFVFGNNQAGCTIFTVQGASTTGSVNFITPTFIIGSNETVFDIKSEIQSGIDSVNFRGCQQEGGVNGAVFAAGSLTQKSLKVISTANSFIPDSKIIGSSYIKSNAAVTSAPTSGTFYDVNFNAGLLTGSNIERFTLTNTTTGELRYDGEFEFNGVIRVSLSALSTGGDRVFHFRFVKDSGAGFAVLPDDMITSVEIGANVGSASLTVPITMNKNDIIKPQVTRVDGNSTVTVRQYSCNVS